MPSQQREQKWSYPLTEVPLDKHGQRTATRDGAASDLIGFDGQLEGGLRPSPGFVQIDSLGLYSTDGATQITNTVTGYSFPVGWVNDRTNPIHIRAGDFWPVNLRTDISDGVYGYVFRVSAGSPNQSAYYFAEAGTALTTGVRELSGWSQTNYGVPTDVVVKGRYCYLLRRGMEPILFFFDESGTFNIDTDTGPGAQPTLRSPDQQVDWPIGLGSPGAQLALTGQLPGNDFAMPTQAASDVRQLDPGDYAFAYQLYDEKSGRRSPISVIAPCQSGLFAGTLVGGSGSGTGDSDTARYACMELVWDSSKWSHAYIYRSVRVQSVGTVFAAGILCQDNFIELTDYLAPDQTGLANPAHKRALYWYEKEDKQLVSEPKYNDYYSFDADMPFGSVAGFLDDTLFVAGIKSSTVDPSNQRIVKDVAEIRWSSPVEANPELFSTLYSRYTPNNERDELLKFVNLSGNLVGFSRNRVYFVRKEAEKVRVMPIHAGYGIVGKRAADEVGSAIYFVNDKGLKALSADGELQDVRTVNRTIVERWRDLTINVSVSYDPTLSCVFVHNPDAGTCGETICLWLGTGMVSELWDAEFGTVARGWSAYPTPELWNFDGTVRPRALFCDFDGNIHIYDSGYSKTILGSSVPGNGTTRYSLKDFTGNSHHNVKDVATGTTSNKAPWRGGGATVPYARLTVDDTAVLSVTMIGRQLYILDGDGWGNQFYIYNVDAGAGYIYVMANDGGTLPTIRSGSDQPRACISPVYCRWVGHQLGVQNEVDMTYKPSDYFEVRQVSSLGVSFTDVAGHMATDDYARHTGLVLVGNSETLAHRAAPRDLEGVATISVASGKPTYYAAFQNTSSEMVGRQGPIGNSLFPGFEIVCTDLYFNALEVRVRGHNLATDRSERPS